MKLILLFAGLLMCASCSMETLYKMRQRQKVYAYEQMDFTQLVSRYMSKKETSVGTVEGVYSVSSLVTKKGKGILSSTEKEKIVSREENFSKVAIIRDHTSGREFVEIPINSSGMPSYSVRGEFTAMSEGNILVYKQFESRGRTNSYTFTFDKGRDILEGIRTENNGNFEYTYRLTYLKLSPKGQ